MNGKVYAKKFIAEILTVFTVLTILPLSAYAENSVQKVEQNTNSAISDDYYSYFCRNIDNRMPSALYELTPNDCLANDVTNVNGTNCIVLDPDKNLATWNFNVQESGNYSVCFIFCALGNTERNVSASISVDGKTPYSELNDFVLPRSWADETLVDNKKQSYDKYGNELRPTQVAVTEFTKYWLNSQTGMYEDPYLIYLQAGNHSVTVKVLQESFAVESVLIGNENKSAEYSKYIKKYDQKKLSTNETIRLEAEDAYRKNTNLLYPVYDRNSAATLPNDPFHICLNSIGQSNWSSVGQKITWKANIKSAGLYKMAFRVRQNLNQAMNSYRTLRINGEIPFKEAQNIAFYYNSDWYIKTLGNKKEDYFVYVEPGDEISLEITAGPLSSALRSLNQTVLKLNEIYRKIIIITGTNPDIYRDYSIDKQIPDLIKTLKETSRDLKSVYSMMSDALGKECTQASSINEMIMLIEQLLGKPFSIPAKISSFKSDIENLGSLILSLGQQPLELDCISFVSENGTLPKKSEKFYKQLSYGFKQFIGSFIVDYSDMNTDSSKNSINVWVTTGRDQAQILSNMIDDTFTAQTGIKINLSMVDTGTTLIQATLADKGPDIALMVPVATPINLAMRGALVDLSQKKFGLNDEIKNQFYESAWTPFYYKNGTYAMPETQVFDVLLYRCDIFNELGIKVPNTWDDFYTVMKTLQSNNLEIGIPEIDSANPGVSLGISTFDKFLFQNDGTYYNSDLTKTLFDTQVAYNAFEYWVKLYSKYGLSRSFDFFNRFRTGEMPLGIVSYSQFNQVEQAAPEIRGLWNIAPIPGTILEDGSINRAESSNGTGCIMLNSAEKKGVEQDAFKFMCWWISSDSQQRFGRELEGTLGTIARYTPANKDAFEAVNWTASQSAIIKDQWKWVMNVNQIPGNYYITRELTNALRAAIDGKDSTRTLTTYNKLINDEIERKCKEFDESLKKGE